ncbi:hydrogenase maturation nickel metallochaperone HypA [Methylocaldum sp.]|uniref:hydrogenase maturation nickel metallochaperone HypA n=1 Tax=Methylocaldum sp. TaxID=1969727 RepID=UPI002D707DA8|nr:hydrogenase maturation nickel metallochaperone HypA [Methylocaldum sp.]HYE36719.1 hydrogenase maturation nickel metallochaperone HypA [Methylocaldum sp.]
MHELSLMQNVRDIIEASRTQQGFRRVRTVRIEVGKLSCVEPDALRFCFDVVMQGTPAEGANLDIIETQGRGVCRSCGGMVELEALYDSCRLCGSHRVDVTAGNELRVRELEVE